MAANTFSIEENARESERLNALLDNGIREKIMRYPGVIDVSVGLKITKDEIVWERCFHVQVKKKITRSNLSADELIPAEIDGIKTDIHEISIASAAVVAQGAVRISNGIGFVNAAVDPNRPITTSGTLGAIGRIKGPCQCNTVGLTNWHVLYVGHKRIEVKEGTRIFQPNAQINLYVDDATKEPDFNNDNNVLGKVVDGIYNGTVDCALVKVNRSCSNCCGTEYHNIIDRLEEISPLHFNGIRGSARANVGDTVFFVGAVSGPSKGYVVSAAASIPTTYRSVMICDDRIVPRASTPGPNDDNTVQFTGQLKIRTDGNHSMNGDTTLDGNRVSRFINHGDSGSLLVNSENMAVGLIFATDGIPPSPQGDDPSGVPPLPPGSPSITLYGYANHYDAVIAALNARGYDFEINYTQPTTGGSSGAPLTTFVESENELYIEWKDRIEAHAVSKAIADAVVRNRDEVLLLINHCRPVTVAWHRAKGPAFTAVIVNNIREEKFDFPEIINGVSTTQLLVRMRDVLLEHGSNGLKDDLKKFDKEILAAVKGKSNFEDILAALQGEVPVENR